MNIGIDVTPILPGGTCGGVKQLVIELLRGFAQKNTADRFILLTAYYNEDIFKEFEQYGMKQVCVLADKSRSPQAAQNHGMLNQHRYPGIVRKNNINVLFCPMTDPLHHEPGIPAVFLICDLQHLYYPSFFNAQELAHRNKLYERIKTKADYVVCISSHTKKTVLEKLHMPEERVFVIPISVHERLGNPGPAKVRTILEKYNLSGKKYCIYPANLWPHKNHKMLLLAFSRFVALHPHCSLDLVLSGEPIDHNSVMEYSRQMGLSERVHLLGYLGDFLIFPSLFEGFGIPLVEAMLYGKPILASNVTSIPEVAGAAALYFDPRKPDEMAAALGQIMGDEGLYRRLVEEGQKQLEKYRYEDMVEQYLAVLHRAAEGGSVAEYAEVTGIYHDCWAGEQIEVGLGAGKGKRVFTLRGHIPEWHPVQEIKLKVTLPDGRKKRYVVRKDEELTMSEQLPEQAGIMSIAVSGGLQNNDIDTRTLSFMVKDAVIVDEGTGKEIYKFDGQNKERILLKNRELYQHIEELSLQLVESEADRRARLDKINELGNLLKESEEDRAARLEKMKTLDALLKESEEDRAARLEKIEELSRRLEEVDSESRQRYEQIEELSEKLRESDADRAARLEKIEELSRRLQEMDLMLRESDKHLRHITSTRAYMLLKKMQTRHITSTRAYMLLKKMRLMP